ncbi:O-antigen ligase family protein [Myxococcus stipitatus]|uniref:O-antigen ligase family protein n=1 Tax=Myxococcus stipitatus TaxID=83455 RepID=UPI0030CDA38B
MAVIPPLTAWMLGPAGFLEAERFFWPKALIVAAAVCVLAARRLFSSRADSPQWVLVGAGTLALWGHLGVGLWSGALSREPWGAVAERLLPLACAGVWYAAMVPHCHKPRVQRRLRIAVWVAASGVAAVALCEAMGLRLPWALVRRPVSTLGGRNQVAAYVGFVLPLVMASLLRRPGPLAWGTTTLLTLVVLLTRARSVWLGLLLTGVVAFSWGWERVLRRGWSPRVPGLLATASALGTAVLLALGLPWHGLNWNESNPLTSSLQRLVEHDQGTGRGRLEQLGVGLAIARDAPLLGDGPGGWNDASARRAHVVSGRHAEAWGDDAAPRSEFVRALVETGLLGTTALLITVGFFVQARWKNWRRFALPPAAACALLVFVVHALLDLPLTRPDTALLVATIAALAGPRRASIRLPSAVARGSALLALIGIGGTACLGAGYYFTAVTRPVSDTWAMARAVRWIPRLEVAERLALQLARDEGCFAARTALADARGRAPHHTGLLCLAAACARDAGEPGLEKAAYESALRVEPHLRTPLTPAGTVGLCAPRVKPSRPATASPLP